MKKIAIFTGIVLLTLTVILFSLYGIISTIDNSDFTHIGGINYTILRNQTTGSGKVKTANFDILVSKTLSDTAIKTIGKKVGNLYHDKKVNILNYTVYTNKDAFEKIKKTNFKIVPISGLIVVYTSQYNVDQKKYNVLYTNYYSELIQNEYSFKTDYNIINAQKIDNNDVKIDVIISSISQADIQDATNALTSIIKKLNSDITKVNITYYSSQKDYTDKKMSWDYSIKYSNIITEYTHFTI